MALFLSLKNKKNLEIFFEEKKRTNQSVLFSGEEGIGKTTLAFYLAHTLLCLKKGKEPCQNCESCLEYQKKCHPDFLAVSPEKGLISIEKVREIINFLSFKPKLSGLKIVIIDDSEKMTKEAQNALLKILEEPNLDNLIILVSSYPEKLLPTILSRLLVIKFSLAKKKEIIDYLVKEFSLSLDKAEEIAQMSQGKIAEAIKLLEKDYFKEKMKAKEILKKIIKGNEIEKILIIEEDLKEEKINFFLKEWLSILRKDYQELINLLKEEKRNYLLKNLLNAYLVINSQNVNQKLLLENIFLKI